MANPGARKRPSKKTLSLLFMALLVLAGLSSNSPAAARPPGDDPVADMTVTADRVEWQAKVPNAGLSLTVAGPGNLTVHQTFEPGQSPTFGLVDAAGQRYPDGVYTYELVVTPVLDDQAQAARKAARESGKELAAGPRLVQSGHFTIRDGTFVTGGVEPEPDSTPLDQVISDDLIVNGSLCVGDDCYDGYTFGADTIALVENTLRISFDDTSTLASFPSNDWRIVINDSNSGGADYFAIQDATQLRKVFVIEAGAPSNSLYIDSQGNVGINTATPSTELHIKDDDTPTVQLEQDESGGWSPQTWDVAGNESNFFIRDVTHGSQLSFRIQPGAPSDALTIKNDGKIGMGTWNPDASLEVETTGSNAKLLLQRTDGTTFKLVATTGKVAFGSETNHRTEFLVNNSPHTTFETNGDVTVESGEVTAVALTLPRTSTPRRTLRPWTARQCWIVWRMCPSPPGTLRTTRARPATWGPRRRTLPPLVWARTTSTSLRWTPTAWPWRPSKSWTRGTRP